MKPRFLPRTCVLTRHKVDVVKEMLTAIGIDLSHKTVRQWVLKFGEDIANRTPCRRRAATGTSKKLPA
jgi:transposase-like protein